MVIPRGCTNRVRTFAYVLALKNRTLEPFEPSWLVIESTLSIPIVQLLELGPYTNRVDAMSISRMRGTRTRRELETGTRKARHVPEPELAWGQKRESENRNGGPV